MLGRFLTSLLMIAALMSLAGETTGDAQVTRNSGNANQFEGLAREGVVWSFRTSQGGSFAPTIIGILTPPQIEPTKPEQNGALWVWCAGPARATECVLKVNVLGTALELANGTWDLQ